MGREQARYLTSPLKTAGLRLEHLSELGAIVIGPDGCCICTRDDRCLNVDKCGPDRCTLEELQKLSLEAIRRRAYQSGGS